MSKKTVRDIELAGKRVLVRVDLNVPFKPGTTTIADDSRIRAVLPTVRYLQERDARIILCSHMGRPEGKVVEELRLKPVAERLRQLLEQEVISVQDCIGPEVEGAVGDLKSRQVLLLENLRFHPEEEKNDPDFARALAFLAEVYVNDAFGAAHRAHASTTAVTDYLPAVSGLLLDRELDMLGRAIEHPQRPLAAVIGGAKVSDKLGVLENLLPRVDMLFIGGGMCATFFQAQGLEVGASLVEEDKVRSAADTLRKAEGQGIALVLPHDVVVAEKFAANAPNRTVPVNRIPDGWYIMDIGPLTIRSFQRGIQECRTVLWNGPMGVFEYEPFASGTIAVATTLARLERAVTVIGGGSTAEAVERLGLAARMTHVSTGGGASLELLEGRPLPGVVALLDKEEA